MTLPPPTMPTQGIGSLRAQPHPSPCSPSLVLTRGRLQRWGSNRGFQTDTVPNETKQSRPSPRACPSTQINELRRCDGGAEKNQMAWQEVKVRGGPATSAAADESNRHRVHASPTRARRGPRWTRRRHAGCHLFADAPRRRASLHQSGCGLSPFKKSRSVGDIYCRPAASLSHPGQRL